MLTILEPTPSTHPSRAWVEAAWQANPQLAPNWWRENLGFTHSKIVLDARTAPQLNLPEGINVVLTAGQNFEAQSGVVRVACLKDVSAFKAGCAEVVLWSVPETLTEAEALQGLTQLEDSLQKGILEAYGLDDPTLGSGMQRWPFEHWLALAGKAAETVWGRKKRPGLKVLMIPFDDYACEPLLFNSTSLKGKAVPLLEHTAHLGLWVLAEPAGLTSLTLTSETAQALADLAQAEVLLHQSLNQQWPHVDGKPVFSILPFLNQGLSPWPHPAMIKGWQTHVWPALQEAFNVYGTHQAGQGWHTAWQNVAAKLPQYAQAAVPTTRATFFRPRKALMSEALQILPEPVQMIALCTAVPGIGGTVVPAGVDFSPLLAMLDIADVGPYFSTYGHAII